MCTSNYNVVYTDFIKFVFTPSLLTIFAYFAVKVCYKHEQKLNRLTNIVNDLCKLASSSSVDVEAGGTPAEKAPGWWGKLVARSKGSPPNQTPPTTAMDTTTATTATAAATSKTSAVVATATSKTSAMAPSKASTTVTQSSTRPKASILPPTVRSPPNKAVITMTTITTTTSKHVQPLRKKGV